MKTSTFKSVYKQFKKKFKQLKNDKNSYSGLKGSYKELKSAYNALEEYKTVLEKNVQQEIKKRLEHEVLMLEKIRFVTMGEMMDAVAHQWIQPLSLISMYTDDLRQSIEEGIIDKNHFIKTLNSIEKQNEHMESTLKEFRNFLNPINDDNLFDLNKVVKSSLKLLEDELEFANIKVLFKKDKESSIKGNAKELQHVVINILHNAKDAFITRAKEDRVIRISTKQKDSKAMLQIEDNAGGIDILMLDKIFNPYVTTKKTFGSSGIGLYISKLIMEKHHADISVQNSKEGAKFTLCFNKS